MVLRIALISEVEVTPTVCIVSEDLRRVAREGVKTRGVVLPSQSAASAVWRLYRMRFCPLQSSSSSPAPVYSIISCHDASPLHSPLTEIRHRRFFPRVRHEPHFHSSTNQTRLGPFASQRVTRSYTISATMKNGSGSGEGWDWVKGGRWVELVAPRLVVPATGITREVACLLPFYPIPVEGHLSSSSLGTLGIPCNSSSVP